MAQTRSTFNSSNSLVSLEGSSFKDDIVQKLGGEGQFQFLVITFCERIRNDPLLKKCYKGIDEKGLIELQKDTILVSFVDVTPSEYQNLRSKLMLRYHLILEECRYPEVHFEALENNFVKAMRDCWVDEAVLEQSKGYFGALQSVLKESGCMNQRMKNEEGAYIEQLSFGIMTSQVICSQ